MLFTIWYFKWVTIYILMGVVFSLMGRPVYNALEKVRLGRFKIPNSINAIVSLLSIWAIVGGILALLVPLLIKEGDRLSKIDPSAITQEMEQPMNKSIALLEKYGVLNFPDSAETTPVKVYEKTVVITLPCDSVDSTGKNIAYTVDTVDERWSPVTMVPVNNEGDSLSAVGLAHKQQLEQMVVRYLRKAIDFAQISNFFGSVFGVITNLLAAIAASTFIAFFFLKDQRLFFNMVLAVVPEKYEQQTITIMQESRKMLSRYFIGLCTELLLVMVCTAIGLMIIGFNIQTAVAIGFFCGFFNIIPYVGPFIGGALGIILGITHNLDLDVATQLYPLLIKMGVVFWLVQLLDNNIFQTVIFSNSVNAHPLEIFLVIILAGTLAGIPGMIFAVPGYTFLRIIAKQFFQNFKFVRSLTKNM